jgi:hypothetical protein
MVRNICRPQFKFDAGIYTYKSILEMNNQTCPGKIGLTLRDSKDYYALERKYQADYQ